MGGYKGTGVTPKGVKSVVTSIEVRGTANGNTYFRNVHFYN